MIRKSCGAEGAKKNGKQINCLTAFRLSRASTVANPRPHAHYQSETASDLAIRYDFESRKVSRRTLRATRASHTGFFVFTSRRK